MVLVRVGQDEDVDPAIPRRQPSVELDEEPIGIGAAVDQHPPAAAALDEDRIALADVEDGDPRRAVGSVGDRHGERRPRQAIATGDDREHGPRASASRPDGPARRRRSWRGRPARPGVEPARPVATRRATTASGTATSRRAATTVHGGSRVDARERQRRAAPGRRCTSRSGGTHAGRPSDASPRSTAPPRIAIAPPEQGDDGGRHRRRDERNHGQVDDRRDDREPPERREHDGQRRGLGRERDAEATRRASQAAGRGRGRQPAAGRSSAQARIPAVARVESWKPASRTRRGSTSRRIAAAQPRAAAARPARPVSRASSTTPAIAAARTTDGDAPANSDVGDDRDRRQDDGSPAAPRPPAERGDRRRRRSRCSSPRSRRRGWRRRS